MQTQAQQLLSLAELLVRFSHCCQPVGPPPGRRLFCPHSSRTAWAQGKELDYEALGREQRALAAIIREHSAGRRVEPPDRLLMRAQVRLCCTHCTHSAAPPAGTSSSSCLLKSCSCQHKPVPALGFFGERASPPQVPAMFDHIRGGGFGGILVNGEPQELEEGGSGRLGSSGGGSSGRPMGTRGARLLTVKVYLTYQVGGTEHFFL